MWPPSGVTLHYCTWAGNFWCPVIFHKLLDDISVYMLYLEPVFMICMIFFQSHRFNKSTQTITLHTTSSLFIWAIDTVLVSITDKFQTDAFSTCHTFKFLRRAWWRRCHKDQNIKRVNMSIKVLFFVLFCFVCFSQLTDYYTDIHICLSGESVKSPGFYDGFDWL